ncbi:hypothetical protein, partial [Aeromonas jandaei]|uniref:hypothetical protein n=1 Tax=Aeromonas jandaei TaxID=650 RepID=UPI001E40D828
CGLWLFTIMSKVSFLSTLIASPNLLLLWLCDALTLLHLLFKKANTISICLHDGVHEKLTLKTLTLGEVPQSGGEVLFLLLELVILLLEL